MSITPTEAAFLHARQTERERQGRASAAPRQDSLSDQLRDVVRVAGQMGCQDAVDWITRAARLDAERQRAAPTTRAER